MKKDANILSFLKRYELNAGQVEAIDAIKNNKIVILRGLAGTAKTFTSVYAAMKLLAYRDIARIAITRPQVTTEKMGFLPGEIENKFDPYLAPFITFFNKFGDAGNNTFSSLVAAEKIRRAPIAFMRGTTIEEEMLLVDEAQNITPDQMLMILTRLGRTGKMVISGDETQDDIGNGHTGLDYAVRLPCVKVIELTENMRDELITEIINNWRAPGSAM